MKPNRIALTLLSVVALCTAAFAESHTYDVWEENYNVQALLGAVRFDDFKVVDQSGSGAPITIDVSTLPQLGGAWMTLPKGDRLQYGLECSFLLGFRFDKINYASLGGSGLYISISTSMWMFDLAGGPYVNLWLTDNLRLYGGAGPLMVYVDYRAERSETGGTADGCYDNYESAFGLGVYARTGFEFRVQDRGMLGLGLRGSWNDVDFSNAGGNTGLAGIAAFVTYTAGF